MGEALGSSTVSGTETHEAASKLVFGLLPEIEPGSGTGVRFDQLASTLISHTVRLAHIKVENCSMYSNYFGRLVGVS